MKNNIKKILLLLGVSVAIIYLYTFLHESGHAIIGLIHGGKIIKFEVGMFACVEFINAKFTNIEYGIMKIFGIVFPVIIMYLSLILYKPKIKNTIYQMSHIMYYIVTTSSLIAPILVSIIYKFNKLTPGDDIVDFIYSTKSNPIVVAIIFTLIMIFNIFVLYKRGTIQKLIDLKKGEF